MKCSRMRVRARKDEHPGEPAQFRTSDRIRYVAVMATIPVLFVALAACSSQPEIPAGVNSRLPASTYGEQRAVANAWIAGQRQLYYYIDQPLAKYKPDYTDPENSFPLMARYFSNPALDSELNFITNIKKAGLNGPSSYSIYTPRVDSISSGKATISFCRVDSGTTTQSGQPGPLALDGGPGGARGTAVLELKSGSWKTVNLESTGVSRC